jgi:hypothetical protein
MYHNVSFTGVRRLRLLISLTNRLNATMYETIVNASVPMWT